MCTRIELFGVAIDPLAMDQAVGQVHAWVAAREARCRYVVTTSVDQLVLLQHHAGLQAAFREAGLILPDGAPVIWASRLLGKPLPQRVAGPEFVPAIFDAADEAQPISVFLLGAAPGVAVRAATNIQERWPAVRVVGAFSPPPGFESDTAENLRILARIADARPDVLIVGFAPPKQELWVHQHHGQIKAHVAMCAGATIDFLAGQGASAPGWMRQLDLEWLHRVLIQPRRLAGRGVRDAWVFPQLVARQWWQDHHRPGPANPVQARS